jgi:hypothetical protein
MSSLHNCDRKNELQELHYYKININNLVSGIVKAKTRSNVKF